MAGVQYEGPGQDEDYLLGSVDEEEKEKAHNATQKRWDMLRKRINRERERTNKIREKATKCIAPWMIKEGCNFLQQPVCAVCDTALL